VNSYTSASALHCYRPGIYMNEPKHMVGATGSDQFPVC